MKATSPSQQLLLAFTVLVLLFAQIMGLHRHVHAEGATAFHPASSELHFADAGLHGDEHGHSHEPAPAGHHAHGDVEIDALGDALAKLVLKLLPMGLLMLVVLLILLPLSRSLPRLCLADPPPRRRIFSLHPPAHGPPRRFSTAV